MQPDQRRDVLNESSAEDIDNAWKRRGILDSVPKNIQILHVLCILTTKSLVQKGVADMLDFVRDETRQIFNCLLVAVVAVCSFGQYTYTIKCNINFSLCTTTSNGQQIQNQFSL